MAKLLLSLLFLPSVIILFIEGVKSSFSIILNFRITLAFVAGFVIYAAVHFFVFTPNKIYVMAHEMTHAFAAWLSGIKVGKIKVGEESGSVEVDKTNAFVALLPYCVPVYAILTAVFYALLSALRDVSGYRDVFIFAFGLFMSFHVLNTFKCLTDEKQEDLRVAGGVIFSVCIIILANSILFLLTFKFLYPDVISLKTSFVNVLQGTLSFWKKTAGYVMDLIRVLKDMLS